MSLPTDRLASARTLVHPYTAITFPSGPQTSMHQLLAPAPPNHELHCRYRSKVCLNLRARKRDGSLHRYCEDHRQRANSNQKNWAQRRMQTLDECDQPGVQIACPTIALPTAQDEEEWALWAHDDDEPGSPLFADEADFELLWQALDVAENANHESSVLNLP